MNRKRIYFAKAASFGGNDQNEFNHKTIKRSRLQAIDQYRAGHLCLLGVVMNS